MGGLGKYVTCQIIVSFLSVNITVLALFSLLRVITGVVNVLQLATDARERKKKFSGSVEVLRFERTLELTRRQLRKTDNIARNDARLQSTMMLMFNEAKNGLRSVSGHEAEGRDAAVTSADLDVPSDSKVSQPRTSQCHISQDVVEQGASRDVRDSGCATSFVAVTTSSMTNVTSSVVVTVVTSSVAKVTASFAASSMTTSSAVNTAATASCVSLPFDANSTATSAADSAEIKLTSAQHSILASAVTSPSTAVMQTHGQSVAPSTVGTTKSTNSVAESADAVALKSIDSVTRKSATSADAITITVAKSVDYVPVLADAAVAKSADSAASTSAKSIETITVTAGKSVDTTARSVDKVAVTVACVSTSSFKTLPISSPVQLSNVVSLSNPQSPSPSPKGHVTFSDHVTEIQPGASSSSGANGKPRRIPPAPPPRKAIKNLVTNVSPTSPCKPRDRPNSAVEPLAAMGADCRPGIPTANGIGRARPLSMAPLATVDSDSDSSVGTESQTGTIRRNTDKRNQCLELRNGTRGRTPPPVPTRKTSSLSSSLASTTKSSEGFLAQDAQYSNLHDVRLECARLKLASGQQDSRPNGPKADGAAKCEETEIF